MCISPTVSSHESNVHNLIWSHENQGLKRVDQWMYLCGCIDVSVNVVRVLSVDRIFKTKLANTNRIMEKQQSQVVNSRSINA